MCLEGLDGLFCLVSAVVSWWDKLVLHVVLLYASFKSLRCLVVKFVVFQSYPPVSFCPPVSDMLVSFCPLFCYALVPQKLVGIEVDRHHYIAVSSLGRVWECSSLVCVNGLGEVRNVSIDAIRAFCT